MKKNIVILLIVLIVFVLYGQHIFFSSHVIEDTVVIPQGVSLTQMADTFEEKGYVNSAFGLRFIAKLKKLGGNVQAGKHTLKGTYSPEDFLLALRGENLVSKDQSITFLEGWTPKPRL